MFIFIFFKFISILNLLNYFRNTKKKHNGPKIPAMNKKLLFNSAQFSNRLELTLESMESSSAKTYQLNYFR